MSCSRCIARMIAVRPRSPAELEEKEYGEILPIGRSHFRIDLITEKKDKQMFE